LCRAIANFISAVISARRPKSAREAHALRGKFRIIVLLELGCSDLVLTLLRCSNVLGGAIVNG
jgi:hypothetical protein